MGGIVGRTLKHLADASDNRPGGVFGLSPTSVGSLRRGASASRRRMATLPTLLLALFCLLLASPSSAAARVPAAGTDPPATFIFVLDGSGSMSTRVEDGRTRWRAACDSIASTVESLPDGVAVEILVFGDRCDPAQWSRRWLLDSPQNRAAAIAFGRNPTTDPRNPRAAWDLAARYASGTALYDAMGWAFERAEVLCANGSRVSIIVLSDGMDSSPMTGSDRGQRATTGSTTWQPNPPSRFGRTRFLCEKLAQLRRDCVDGVYYQFSRVERSIVAPCDPDAIGESLVFTQLAVGAAIDGPSQLPSLAEGPQTLRVRLEVPAGIARSGLDSIEVRFDPAPGSPRVQLSPSRLPLRSGSVEIAAAPVGAPPEGEVRGQLVFLLGSSREATISVSSPRPLPVGFSAPAAISLDPMQVLPREGQVFLKGDPVRFTAPQVAGAAATWQFGDGRSGSGFSTTHAYGAEGEQTFTLTVEKAPARPFTLSRRIRIVDVSVAIESSVAAPIAGETVEFRARTSGPVQSLRWQVAGADAAADSDGVLRVQFPVARTYEVRAIATTPFRPFDARLAVPVGEGVSLTILQPDAEIPASVETRFAARAGGPIEQVRWSARTEQGETIPLGATPQAPVRERDGDRLSELLATIPAGFGGRTATITATAVVSPALAARIGELSTSVELPILPPGLSIRVVEPLAGEVLAYGTAETFRARLLGSGVPEVTEVRWVFKGADGQVAETFSTSLEPAADGQGVVSEVRLTPDAALAGRLDVEVEAVWPGEQRRDARRHRVQLPAVNHRLIRTDSNAATVRFGTDLAVEVEPATQIREVRFDFGDGAALPAEPGVLRAFHRFRSGGRFDVRAQATLEDGSTIDLGPLRLLVDVEPPRAVASPRHGGRALAAAPLVAGGQIELVDESTGDIMERRWTLRSPDPADETPVERILEPGQQSVTIPAEALGVHSLRLEVVGYPDAPGADRPRSVQVIEFANRAKRDWTLSILAAAIGGFLTIVAFWFVAGQFRRRWRVTLAATNTDDQQWERALERGVGTRPGRRGPLGGWSWLRKRGEMSVDRLLARAHPELHRLLSQGEDRTSLGTLVIEGGTAPLRLDSMVFQLERLRQQRNTIAYAIVLDSAMRSEEIGRAVGGTPKILVEVRRDPTSMWSDTPLVLLPIIALAATVSISIWAFLQGG